jgi:hypothetical protein
MPDFPLRIADSVLRLTPSPFAVSVTVKPKGSRQSSFNTSPGCGIIGVRSCFILAHSLTVYTITSNSPIIEWATFIKNHPPNKSRV